MTNRELQEQRDSAWTRVKELEEHVDKINAKVRAIHRWHPPEIDWFFKLGGWKELMKIVGEGTTSLDAWRTAGAELIREVRESEKITGEDLAIRINSPEPGKVSAIVPEGDARTGGEP